MLHFALVSRWPRNGCLSRLVLIRAGANAALRVVEEKRHVVNHSSLCAPRGVLTTAGVQMLLAFHVGTGAMRTPGSEGLTLAI